MKRTIKALVCIAIAAFTLTSCNKEKPLDDIDEGPSGKVTYTLETPGLHLKNTDNDINGSTAIENAFSKEILKVPGVTKVKVNYAMEGNYKKCDKAIVAACEAAEKEASKVTLDGYMTVEVQATYEVGGEVKRIYEHTFGNKN